MQPRTKRDELDRYYTPDHVALNCVRRILPELATATSILEPSGGGGAFVRALDALASPATTDRRVLDIDPEAPILKAADRYWPSWTRRQGDFLAYHQRAGWIIGNPTYRHALKHTRHALGLADQGVAFLLRLGFLEGRARLSFWQAYPPDRVVILSKRPSFTGDGRNDSSAYAFYVWNQRRARKQIEWIGE